VALGFRVLENPTSGSTSLPPGTDCDLTIDGGTLRLQGGEYVFCSVTTNNGSEVVAAASSTLLIVDSFDVLPNSRINVAAHRVSARSYFRQDPRGLP
jgi:hypothetical protein